MNAVVFCITETTDKNEKGEQSFMVDWIDVNGRHRRQNRLGIVDVTRDLMTAAGGFEINPYRPVEETRRLLPPVTRDKLVSAVLLDMAGEEMRKVRSKRS